jgi:hypothetical protein
MRGKKLKSEENISKMFSGRKGTLTSDEELALDIIQRFNICSESLEAMPALEEHLEPLFSRVKQK